VYLKELFANIDKLNEFCPLYTIQLRPITASSFRTLFYSLRATYFYEINLFLSLTTQLSGPFGTPVFVTILRSDYPEAHECLSRVPITFLYDLFLILFSHLHPAVETSLITSELFISVLSLDTGQIGYNDIKGAEKIVLF
jgi:hypothetical protein